MKSRSQFLSTALCLLGTFHLTSATQLPTTVQFDIVFPKNNTAYKPLYPFPVVFGLHNGSAAWPYVIYWDWEILAVDIDPSANNIIATGGWIPGIPGMEMPAPPQDTHLIIDPVNELINTTVRNLFLRYSFGITNSCNETTGEVPLEHNLDVSFHQGIYFNLDPENGEVPDLTAVGPCAIPVGSIGILKDILHNGGVCPILAQEPQFTQPCALPLNSTVASQVSARMLAHTGCSDQRWPNVTGLTGKCRPKSSGENRLWSDATLFTSVMVFTSFGIYFLL
jgi:hypothetical protein